jgi:hypothetical protein
MYGWILLAAVIGAVGWWAYTRGPGIVTPIPKYVVATVTSRNGGFLTAWRLFLLLLLPLAVVVILEISTSQVTLWIIAGLVAAIAVPQIRRVLIDYWNFNLWRFGGS